MIPAALQVADVAERALAELPAFARLIEGIPYERKGILYSEIFFFALCARAVRPRRILESGRARAQSTLLLARCFPDCEIVSVEHDRNSPDVAIAAERLRGCGNVRLLFGDATRLLPDLCEEGDVALIDGPKGHRGLRLAARLLATGCLPLVFLHDTGYGSVERDFLARRFPEALYSDDARLAMITRALDRGAEPDIPPENRWGEYPPAAGYGFSLACLPWRPEGSYLRSMAWLAWHGLTYRLGKRAAASLSQAE